MTDQKNDYRVIGTRPIRHDGVDKVTGRAKYGADVHFPDMLYGAILRSPHAHAKILSIDTTKAEADPNVKAIVTARDLPLVEDKIEDLGEVSANIKFLSDNILASDKALYKGHPIAALCATEPYTAQKLLDLIEVEYEVLDPVIDVCEAIKSDAPILHPNLKTSSLGKDPDQPSNIASHFRNETSGDLEIGFAESDLIVEREFTTVTVHQGYIEPQNATAVYNPDGELTVYCSTQGAFGVRDQLSEILKIPQSEIKVVPMEIGGGFGGKIQVYIEPTAALLSKKSGKSVKIVMSRAEVFEGTGPGPGTFMRVKMGVKNDGTITAATAELYFEAGAYPGSAVGPAAGCMFAPYKIPHCRIDGYDIVVNKPKSMAYRAPGAPNGAFAVESVIDEICQKLNIDPLKFRLKNGAKQGDRRPDGPIHGKIGYLETVSVAIEHDHYNSQISGKNCGRGVASGFWFNGAGRSSVTINVNSDGQVSLIEGSTDIGGTRASIAMQAAETLGIAAEDVHPSVADTNSVGYTGVTGGSRTTHATGLVAIRAAESVRDQMIEKIADRWEVEADQVKFENGIFSTKKDGEIVSMNFKEAAGKTGPIVGSSSFSAGGAGGGFATHIVDVEVDLDLGKVQILRYTAVQDVGKAIHPSYVEGQIQGGVAQGVGWALHEGYFYGDDGAMHNAGFLDYRMPTSYDLPMIEAVLVEVPNPGHPFGVRGVGEVPIVPPLAAVANAIARAIGTRLSDLPMDSTQILTALGKI